MRRAGEGEIDAAEDFPMSGAASGCAAGAILGYFRRLRLFSLFLSLAVLSFTFCSFPTRSRYLLGLS